MSIEQALKDTEPTTADHEAHAVQRAHRDKAWQIGEAIFAHADSSQWPEFWTAVHPDRKRRSETVITGTPWLPRTVNSEIRITREQHQYPPSWLGRVILRKSTSEPYTVGYNLYVRPRGREFGAVRRATIGPSSDAVRFSNGSEDPFGETAGYEVIRELEKIAGHVGADLPEKPELAEL